LEFPSTVSKAGPNALTFQFRNLLLFVWWESS